MAPQIEVTVEFHVLFARARQQGTLALARPGTFELLADGECLFGELDGLNALAKLEERNARA